MGSAPAILVTALSAIVGTIWADPTGSSPVVFYSTSFLLFASLASVIVALVHYLTASLARLKQHEEQLALVNRELKHRIKNLFSITNAICRQTIRSGTSADEMEERVTGRIMAIASAQDLLTSVSQGAELSELVASLVDTLAPAPSRVRSTGAAIHLSADTTTPFALILHELATNALKYGAWSQAAGLVHISWKVERDDLLFLWREHDGPAIAPPLREGLGSSLIKTSLPGATVTHDLKADGLECQIQLPLKQ